MPHINLSALNGQELRRLLDASRARGDAPLAYQILQEMAVRREAREARSRSLLRRPAEPRVLALNLDEPDGADDDLPPMPHWRAPTPPPEPEAAAAPPAEPGAEAGRTPEVESTPTPAQPRSRRAKTPPPAVAADTAEPADPLALKAPRGVWDDEPPPAEEAAASLDLRLDRPEREPPRAPRRFRAPPGAGFAAGLAVGAALSWWAAGSLQPPPAAVPPAAAPVQTAAVDPPPATLPITVASEAAPPLETLPEPTGGPLPPDTPEGPLASPDAVEAEVATDPAPQPPTVVRVAQAGSGACAAEPTPADREICNDPGLQRLQRELRQAYAEALEAHEDRDLLRQRQLAWREARNTVAEPERLARLYEQRIRKLNAATAEARQER